MIGQIWFDFVPVFPRAWKVHFREVAYKVKKFSLFSLRVLILFLLVSAQAVALLWSNENSF